MNRIELHNEIIRLFTTRDTKEVLLKFLDAYEIAINQEIKTSQHYQVENNLLTKNEKIKLSIFTSLICNHKYAEPHSLAAETNHFAEIFTENCLDV